MKPAIAVDFSALDPNFKEHATRGIGRYAFEIKKYLDQQKALVTDLQVDYFDHRKIMESSRVAKILDYLPAGRVTAKQQIFYPFRLNSGELKKYQALHFLAQMDAPAWCPKPYILTVHDLIPLVCADLYKADNPNWRYQLARFFELQAIKNASLILTNSVCTKNDLVRILQLNPEKIEVTLLGVDQLFFDTQAALKVQAEVLQRLQLSNQSYFLYVGGIDPRKNRETLLKVYAELKKLPSLAGRKLPKLVLVGKYAGHKDFPKLEQQLKELNLFDDLIITGYLSDIELASLYHAALALCFFSLYEGFGLTVLEAFASGCPVIASNNSAIPEVSGNCAELVDPQDLRACLAAMESLILNGDRGSRQERINQAKLFNWHKTGEQTLAAYHKFFSQHG